MSVVELPGTTHGRNEWICQLCRMVLHTSEAQHAHEKYHCPHRGLRTASLPAEPPPTFDCPHCHEEFISVEHLVDHVIVNHRNDKIAADTNELVPVMDTTITTMNVDSRDVDVASRACANEGDSLKENNSSEQEHELKTHKKDMINLENKTSIKETQLTEIVECSELTEVSRDKTLSATDENDDADDDCLDAECFKENAEDIVDSHQTGMEDFTSVLDSESYTENKRGKRTRTDSSQQEKASSSFISSNTSNEGLACCGKTFRTLPTLNRHRKLYHSMSENESKLKAAGSGDQLTCPICSNTYSLKRTLTRHIKNVHGSEKGANKSVGEVIQEGEDNSQVKLRKSEPKEKTVGKRRGVNSCSLCPLSIKGSLHMHMWIAHGVDLSKNRVLYQCNVCGQRCSSKINLQSHMSKHTGNKEFICKICDTGFKHASSLQKHVKLHNGEKNFVCKLCGKQFARKGYLQQHERIHSGEKPYKCIVCEKQFTQKTSLNVHMKSHHGIAEQQVAAEPVIHRRVKPLPSNGSAASGRCNEVVVDQNKLNVETVPEDSMAVTLSDSIQQRPMEIDTDKEIAAAEILINMDTDVVNSGGGIRGGGYGQTGGGVILPNKLCQLSSVELNPVLPASTASEPLLNVSYQNYCTHWILTT